MKNPKYTTKDYVKTLDGLAKGRITKVLRTHGGTLQYIVCGGYYFESELTQITKEESFALQGDNDNENKTICFRVIAATSARER